MAARCPIGLIRPPSRGTSTSTTIGKRYNDLEAEKTAARATIAQLDAADEAEPGRPSAADMALLDALPYVALNLADAPEPLLRTLFEITQLGVRLHNDSDHVTIPHPWRVAS